MARPPGTGPPPSQEQPGAAISIIFQLFFNYFSIIPPRAARRPQEQPGRQEQPFQLFFNYFSIIFQLFFNYPPAGRQEAPRAARPPGTAPTHPRSSQEQPFQLFFKYFSIIFQLSNHRKLAPGRHFQLFFNYFSIINPPDFSIIFQLFFNSPPGEKN